MFLVLLVLFICDVNGQVLRGHPQVLIHQGLLIGNQVRTDTGYVNAFLGIPYAAAPVGFFRFYPPQKHRGWNGTLQATQFKNRCPQLPITSNGNIDEDCLYLNIWTPENALKYGPLPVIIFFDGYRHATSSEVPVNGQDLASEGVVVVTVSYRLNVFGFFCLATEQARGNYGLLDQYFSLLWTRENIRAFGGDPQKITLLGHGSGAASIVLHMVSPRTAGLFQRAIVSSGSAVAPWYIDNDPVIASKEIIRILGCNLYEMDSLRCLRSKPADSILRAYEEYIENNQVKHMFYPVVDTFLHESNQYLPIEVGKVLKEGTYFQVPILTGISKPIINNEQVFWAELASKGYSQLEHYMIKSKIPSIMKQYRLDGFNKDDVFDLITWKYVLPCLSVTKKLLEEVANIEFDSMIEAPHFLQINYLLSSFMQQVYVYQINYNGFGFNTTDYSLTSDVLFLFGPTQLMNVGRRRFNSEEHRLSVILKQLWKNFIVFGNPVPNNEDRSWRKYTSQDKYIEYIGGSPVHKEEEFKRAERLMFWTQLLPKFAQRGIYPHKDIPKELQNSPDPAAGFRHGVYTLLGLVMALLALLLICVILLKKKYQEQDIGFHLNY